MKFFYPEFLWFLLLIPLIIILGIRRFFSGERFLKMSGQGREKQTFRLILGIKLFFMVISFCGFLFFLVLALAEPVLGNRPILEDNEGSDVCFVVDISRSMLAEDLDRSRMSVARDSLHLLLRDLVDCRFALVVFAGEAQVFIPMTEDISSLENTLNYLGPPMVTHSGSNIEKALDRAIEVFPEGVNRRKLVILVTDGESLEGSPSRAARKLREKNIKIYALGAGTEAGGLIPLEEGKIVTDNRGKPVVSQLNFEQLENITSWTGGSAYRVQEPDGLTQLVQTINGNTSLATRTGIRYHRTGHYQIYLFLALLCLVVNFFVRNIKWKRYL